MCADRMVRRTAGVRGGDARRAGWEIGGWNESVRRRFQNSRDRRGDLERRVGEPAGVRGQHRRGVRGRRQRLRARVVRQGRRHPGARVPRSGGDCEPDQERHRRRSAWLRHECLRRRREAVLDGREEADGDSQQIDKDDRMDAILKTLSDLEGVNGAVVTDARGQVVAYRAHAVYDLPLLQQVGHATVTAIDSIKLLHEDWESISAQFSEGKLLIRNIARGKGPEYTLSVIADARLNVSFAGVAIRVAVGKLKTVLEAEAAAPLGMAGRPPLAAPSGRGSSPDGVTNGLSWSECGGSSGMSASGMNGVDAASSVVLAGCTKALARSVGPMAKRYVKEAVSMLWPDRPFSRDQLPVLVAELEKYLANPEDASQFRKTVAKISV